MTRLERLAKKHGRLIICVEAADDDTEIEYRVSCGLTASNFGVGETLNEALDDFEEAMDGTPDNVREEDKS
jgi:hypothetical protein